MKKYLLFLPALIVIFLFLYLNSKSKSTEINGIQSPAPSSPSQRNLAMVNPASKHCVDKGGKLELISQKDGSQFGLCKLEDYSCEEWAYYRGECTVEEDEQKIKQALIGKGLDLAEMKVVIYKHLGEYIEGGVVPISAPAGGGYVFAAKVGDEMKIVADGNGAIMCSSFTDFPDFPTHLIPSCIDSSGNLINR